MSDKPLPSAKEVREIAGLAYGSNFDPLNERDVLSALELENEDILQRTKELTPKLDEWAAALAKVEGKNLGDDNAADLTDFLNQVGSTWTLADNRRDKKKRTYDVVAKVVQTFYKGKILDFLDGKRAPLKAKLSAWIESEKARKAAIARAALEEARKKLEAAKTAEEVKAVVAEVKTIEKTAKAGGIRTDFGSTAHGTSRWDFDVVDISKVPMKFLVIDRPTLMAYIGTGKPDSPVVVPGILVKRVSGVATG